MTKRRDNGHKGIHGLAEMSKDPQNPDIGKYAGKRDHNDKRNIANKKVADEGPE